MNKAQLGKIIRSIRISLGLKQKEFGIRYLDLNSENAQRLTSQYELGTHEIKATDFLELLEKIGLDIPALFDASNERSKELIHDLFLARQVLISKTGFADALKLNIRQFHEAVEEKKKRMEEESGSIPFMNMKPTQDTSAPKNAVPLSWISSRKKQDL